MPPPPMCPVSFSSAVEAPQIVILDHEQDLHAAHAARLLQDAQQLLHARPVVERGAEIVDAQERPAGRRRRHRVLVERRSPSTTPQATPRDFRSGISPARTSEVLPMPASP